MAVVVAVADASAPHTAPPIATGAIAAERSMTSSLLLPSPPSGKGRLGAQGKLTLEPEWLEPKWLRNVGIFGFLYFYILHV